MWLLTVCVIGAWHLQRCSTESVLKCLQAAAALAVGVGSLSDPDHLPVSAPLQMIAASMSSRYLIVFTVYDASSNPSRVLACLWCVLSVGLCTHTVGLSLCRASAIILSICSSWAAKNFQMRMSTTHTSPTMAAAQMPTQSW